MKIGVTVNPTNHPRVGGEKGLRFPAFFTREGSPPRGRGKVTHGEEVLKGERITPAWAGKRISNRRCRQALPDHPRVGGEKALMPENRLVMQGSPPRGRGKAQAFRVRPVGRGITPAWAGKSGLVSHVPCFVQDHPRVGGEKYIQCTNGKQAQRITPAWAGKSLRKAYRGKLR